MGNTVFLIKKARLTNVRKYPRQTGISWVFFALFFIKIQGVKRPF
jgi:hypothetical protein